MKYLTKAVKKIHASDTDFLNEDTKNKIIIELAEERLKHFKKDVDSIVENYVNKLNVGVDDFLDKYKVSAESSEIKKINNEADELLFLALDSVIRNTKIKK